MNSGAVETVPGTNETIPESTFLLTELKYTLGQLHVQLGDLDSQQLNTAQPGHESAVQIVRDMIDAERKDQAHYAQILGAQSPPSNARESVPLPIIEAEEQPGPRAQFEHLRGETIALLEQAQDPWPPELIETVKQQVARDRQCATKIAELRKESFETDQRPDLDQPLTQAAQANEPEGGNQPGPSDQPVAESRR
jgi:hypothetical protein